VRIALLWLAAALISGFTLRRFIGPLDEGILMQAAGRMADGQWPWRDFGWAYGPGSPLFVLAANAVLGDSLLWWRLLRVASDATAAVLIWALVRESRPGWALPAWAAAALTAAQPVSANPTAPALAFALGSVYLATLGRAGWAGAAAAGAACFRPDVGVLAAVAAVATFAAAGRAPEWRRAGASSGAASWGGGRSSGGAASWGGAARPRATGAGPRVFSSSRSARTRPPAPGAGVLTCLLVAAGVGVALYLPFLIAAGPGTVWDALVVQASRDGSWWRLPFPPGYDGGDVKDFATWLMPYAAFVTLVAAGFRFRRVAGLFVLGVGALVYYRTRADLEHAQTLLIVTAGLAALIRPNPLGAAVLALLILVGAANRVSALFRPPDLAPLESVRVPPADARDIARVKALVQRLVPEGEPIYVAPRRSDLVTFSNPLLHYLLERPNVLRRDVLLQAKPEEQQRIVAALRSARPVVVRWTSPESARPEPNRRGRPSGSTALDDFLSAEYELEARFGHYEVLVPRSRASR
jgi:hypothetical protein